MGRSVKTIDYEAIERDYRIGQLSIRQIAEKHNVAVSAITRRAKNEGWTRDLSEAVHAATKAKVRAAVVEEAHKRGTKVRADVAKEVQKRDTEEAQATFSDVDVAASINTMIIMRHQKRAVRLGALLEHMLGELEEVSANPVAIEQLVLAVGQNDPLAADGINQLRSVYKRMDALKVASDINIKVQDAERKACDIGGSQEEGGANGGNGNTTNIFIGLQATAGFFGQVAVAGGGRTLPQSVQDRPLLPAQVRTQPA